MSDQIMPKQDISGGKVRSDEVKVSSGQLMSCQASTRSRLVC